MFCALVICLIDLAFPYLSRSALNHLLPQQEYRVFFLLIGFFAVAYVGKGLLYLLSPIGGTKHIQKEQVFMGAVVGEKNFKGAVLLIICNIACHGRTSRKK